MAVSPTPVWVPSQRPLAPSATSVTSVTNDKGDNKMILGAVHISPGIWLTAEETPRKPQIGDRLTKVVRPVIASNAVAYLQMRSVGSYSTSGREYEGKKERTGEDKLQPSDSGDSKMQWELYKLICKIITLIKVGSNCPILWVPLPPVFFTRLTGG